MADGFKIGSAWIDVLPNTDGFSERLKAAVDEAADADSAKVKLKPEVDKASLAKADAEISDAGGSSGEGFGAKFKNALSSVGGGSKFGLIADGIMSSLAVVPGAIGLAAIPAGIAFAGTLVSTISSSLQTQQKTLQTAIQKLQTTKNPTAADEKTLAADKAQLAVINKQAAAYDQVNKAASNLKSTAIGVATNVLKASGILTVFTSALNSISSWLGKSGVQSEFTGLFKTLGDDVKPLLTMIEGLITNLLPGFTKMLQSVSGPFQGFAKIVGGVVASNLGGFFANLAPGMAASVKLIGQILSAVSSLLPPIAKLASTLAVALQPALGAVIGFLAKWLGSILNFLAKNPALVKALAAIALGWKLLALAMDMNPFVAIISGIILAAALITKYHETIWKFILKIWGDVTSFLHRTWSAIANGISSAWNALVNFFKKWGVTILEIFAGILNPGVGIALLFAKFHKQITGAIEAAWNAIASFFTGIWNTIYHGVDSAWGRIANFFSSIMGDVKGVFQNDINFIVGLWDDLWSTVSNIVGKISGAVSKVENIGKTVLHDINPANWFATGGIVPGYAPGQDTVHAMLSPGEAVLVPEAVKAIGAPTIHAINQHYSSGRTGSRIPNHFDAGGLVGGSQSGAETIPVYAFNITINDAMPTQSQIEKLKQDLTSATAGFNI